MHGTRIERTLRLFIFAIIPVAIAANIFAIYMGAPTLRERKAEIEGGLRVWPEQRDKLVHFNPAEADRIMQAYVNRKFGGTMPKQDKQQNKGVERK